MLNCSWGRTVAILWETRWKICWWPIFSNIFVELGLWATVSSLTIFPANSWPLYFLFLWFSCLDKIRWPMSPGLLTTHRRYTCKMPQTTERSLWGWHYLAKMDGFLVSYWWEVLPSRCWAIFLGLEACVWISWDKNHIQWVGVLIRVHSQIIYFLHFFNTRFLTLQCLHMESFQKCHQDDFHHDHGDVLPHTATGPKTKGLKVPVRNLWKQSDN